LRLATLTRAALVISAAAGIGACGARSTLEVDGATDTSAASGGFGGAGGAGGRGGMGGATVVTVSSTVSTTESVTSTAETTSSVTTTSRPPCLSDDECDDGVPCTVDQCLPQGCISTPDDGLCDDGLLCTADHCDSAVGCYHPHSDAPCDDGLACTIDSCDDVSDSCENAPCDGACDDGNFCNGVERCDSAIGCTEGAPSCELDLPCAVDVCNEMAQSCQHAFPLFCFPPDVHLLVTDSGGRLYDVTPFHTPTQTLIATPKAVHLDIAILDGRWFVMDSSLRELYPGTNDTKATISSLQANSLGAGPDHMLYAADTQVYRIDPDSGAFTVVGNLPPGHSSSGDLAFLGDRMFVSTDSPCGGALVELDLATGDSTVLGGDGLGCVYGLANVDGALYIVNCDGKIGTFDPDTGQVRILATTPVMAYGADALP
jgi:hypothetical protein